MADAAFICTRRALQVLLQKAISAAAVCLRVPPTMESVCACARDSGLPLGLGKALHSEWFPQFPHIILYLKGRGRFVI